MRDLVVLAVIVGFFALCAAYVRWCDRIIGPDPDLDELATGTPDPKDNRSPDAEVVAS
jgi:hypothetical protein